MVRVADKWRQNLADRAKAITPLPVRRTAVKVRLGARNRTASWRTVPDLLIVGGQRCGTSSLYKWLGRHPNVAPSLRKEIEYFSIDYAKGEAWYRAHFPLEVRRRLAGATGRPFLTFEATPDYLFDPRVPERVASLLPDVKLIAMLREPADRAVSHYHHNVRLGHEPLDLEAALLAEEQRLADGWSRVTEDPYDRAVEFRRFAYVARGRYADQIERWRRHLPAEQMLVVRSEELFSDPAETFARITRFLGLPDWQPAEFRNYSYLNALDGDYPPPSAAARRYLEEQFAEPNARLVELLGDDFRWTRP